ncbi:MAG: UDP-N-acetyl-D-mannosamine dehydrogenase [Myxococcota bacterium]|nr:UDP-N-acetyl-D-mannosamine dehydrogenase [Myxococcota bacterium]
MGEARICVVGMGYIGLPTASFLATKGYSVVGVDVRDDVVAAINAGRLPIVEPDLDILLKSAVNSGNLVAVMEPQPADIFIMAVPTPFVRDENLDPTPDLSYVEAAACSMAPVLERGNLVILESTSPVGTTEKLAALLGRERPDLVGNEGLEVQVAHCPERVLPGRILLELVENDRIVGGIDSLSTERAAAFYREFVRGEVIGTDCRSAELSKLVENSFRDVNIAFANELSMVCEHLGMNVWEVIRLANRHPRVSVLRPGAGVGGHCIAVDPWFIVSSAPEQTRVIRTAREVNDSKSQWVLERILDRASRFNQPRIACLGLAFKPDIDDLRESPALEIARGLRKVHGDRVLCVEPNLESYDEFPLSSLSDALSQADIIAVLVSHRSFSEIDADQLDEKVVIDAVGAFRR